MSKAWRISFFDGTYDVPSLSPDAAEKVRDELAELEHLVRTGERRRPKVIGLIPRTPELLTVRERFAELERLERSQELLADALLEQIGKLRVVFDELSAGARKGLVSQAHRLLELDATRREVRDLARESGDRRLLEGASRSRDRLQIAVRVLARASLLIVQRLDAGLEQLAELESRQRARRAAFDELTQRLAAHRKLLQLDEALDHLGQSQSSDETLIDLGASLEDLVLPLRRLLDDVEKIDDDLRRLVAELRDIANVVRGGYDERDLPPLGRGELLLADLLRSADASEDEEDVLDTDGRRRPALEATVEKILDYIELELGPDGSARAGRAGRRDASRAAGDAPRRPPTPAHRSAGRRDSAKPRPRPARRPAAATLDVPVRDGWIVVAPGSFRMGSPPDEPGRYDREGPKEVTISLRFAVSATPVTQAEFRRVMGYDPSSFKHPRRPVERVSWHEAAAFCNALSIEDGLEPAYIVFGDKNRVRCELDPAWSFPALCPGYRLPTEAEWEYAARAGTEAATPGGELTWAQIRSSDDTNPVHEPIAWFFGNSDFTTHPVARKAPNDWGLYDVLGNVAEWCHDWYAPRYRDRSTDPTGPARGTEKVVRGGGYKSLARTCRLAYREGRRPTARASDLGFRPVRTLFVR